MAATKAKLLLFAMMVLTQQALGKYAECKTKMSGKKSESVYCTKFGTAQHDTLEFLINSRVLNAPHLTVSNNVESVKFEIGVFADQDYERFDSKTSCYDKRKVATQLLTKFVPVDGEWSSVLKHPEDMSQAKVFTLKRPKMYYFEVLDCAGEINRVFKSGQNARLHHELIMITNDGNQFSYEDIGLL